MKKFDSILSYWAFLLFIFVHIAPLYSKSSTAIPLFAYCGENNSQSLLTPAYE